MDELPPGLYEDLITSRLSEALQRLTRDEYITRPVDPGEADVRLARYVGEIVRRALLSMRGDDPSAVAQQATLANKILTLLGTEAPGSIDDVDLLTGPPDLLLAVLARRLGHHPTQPADRPETPLTQSALLVNGVGQPRLGSEIQKELASADSVDLISAFIRWAGVRILERPLRDLHDRGGRIRVITTTYLGATERKALDYLARLGAEVKVSYDTRTTRLHAKAWLLYRRTLSTAYIGSSNLSKTALIDGLEWNVRIAEVEQPHLFETFRATFDGYWADSGFETYDPDRDRARFDDAIASERPSGAGPSLLSGLLVRPYPFQEEVLETLKAQREIHDRHRNLVVMATGTGKTVVAALDYQRLREMGSVESLLFVAHRQEILSQSLRTFRDVLRRGDFGEEYMGGRVPRQWKHVFASVQSLSRLDLDSLVPDQFSMVVVDEFHHAEAPTYSRLIGHLLPRELVGLTATPERTDGQDVRRWFGGRIAVELRLWEALDRGLLSPFQYFGVADDVDLSGVTWTRGRYDPAELARRYVDDLPRVRKVIQTIEDKIDDPRRMRALGFCVSIDHARFMAEQFTEAGLEAKAVSADTDAGARKGALDGLRDGSVRCVFAVDLFNEGVDVPEVDTVLFLRPTESATVFLQQLGRGLRLAENKACLTVLDFIGNQRAEFRFDLRFQALTGSSRKQLVRQIECGFPYLPPGCHIELDPVAQATVLHNVRKSLALSWPQLAAEVRRLGPEVPSLDHFITEQMLEFEDVYRDKSRSWVDLLALAGLRDRADDGPLGLNFARLVHTDDLERLQVMRDVASGSIKWRDDLPERQRRLLTMLHFGLRGSVETAAEAGATIGLASRPDAAYELEELSGALRARLARTTQPLEAERIPLRVHGAYTRDEVLAAFGVNNPSSVREGVRYVPEEKADLLFVTLHKTEEHFSPSTMYRDRALEPDLFQWESQSTTSARSKTGQRYIHHADEGTSVHLFVRETRRTARDQAAAYLYAGPAQYVTHERERPIEFVWRLDHPLPADLYQVAKAVPG